MSLVTSLFGFCFEMERRRDEEEEEEEEQDEEGSTNL